MNALYAKGAKRMLDAAVSFLADDIRAVLVSTAYLPNLSADEFLSQISANVLGAAVALTGKTTTGGVFDADDTNFAAVAAGANAQAVVLFKNTGDPATSPLLFFVDVLTGFPFATNGGDILVRWDNGVDRIFALAA